MFFSFYLCVINCLIYYSKKGLWLSITLNGILCISFISLEKLPSTFKTGRVIVSPISFCLSGKAFICPSDLKDNSPGRVFLAGSFYFFVTLNISFYSHLACRVSAERSVDSPVGSFVGYCLYSPPFF